MGNDAETFEGGPELGLSGLEAAIARIHEANRNLLTGGGQAPIARALSEALFWTAALDDFFATDQGAEKYWTARAGDADGRTAAGLIFARNMLSHGLHVAGAIQLLVHPPTLMREGDTVTLRWARLPGRDYGSGDRGTVLSFQLTWVNISQLPSPTSPQYGRDEWYRDLIAGRPLTHPFDSAYRWFSRQRG